MTEPPPGPEPVGSAGAEPPTARDRPGLLDRARRLADRGGRRLLGITGPPGAGKSTLASSLGDALGGRATVVPMDGFHLADDELRRLGRLPRKGAPDTFDAAGYIALLDRLRTAEPDVTVYAPAFDRRLDQPIAGSIPVVPDTPLVVTEGNYLLLDNDPWSRVRTLLDEVWYVELDPVERERRLVVRHRRFGKTHAAADRFVHTVDRRHAGWVAETRRRADLLVRVTGPEGPGDA